MSCTTSWTPIERPDQEAATNSFYHENLLMFLDKEIFEQEYFGGTCALHQEHKGENF